MMWADILTTAHEIDTGIQAMLKFGLINLRDCNVGVSDGRDL
jgi:hypothetical protein